MNIKKRVLSAGLTFASVLLLAACGQSGSDTKTYSSTFSGILQLGNTFLRCFLI
ncbi:lipoprotein, putative [Streptococcus pneumoniae]|nr:lipoprotein, putative [Streptococcus pneumoniae]